jgi:hypothetical protein
MTIVIRNRNRSERQAKAQVEPYGCLGTDDDETEWIVPVRWLKTVPADQAITFKGKYGNQNSATKLTHALTRETVLERLGLTEEALDEAEAT